MRQLLLLLPLLAGCSLAPDFAIPSLPIPQSWKQAGEEQGPQQPIDQWWKNFGSPELDTLMSQALAQNNDLNAAIARVEQARATAQIAGAPLWPSLDASGSAARDDTSSSRPDRSYRASAALSYEVDLFGRNRSNAALADYSAQASAYDRDALAIIVASDTATGYFSLLSLKDRLKTARINLANAEEVARIVEARFNEGRVSGLEQAQQRTALANTRAAVASLESQHAAAESALAVLLARPPQEFSVTTESLAGLQAPFIAAALPATVIEKRPDIRSSEQSLRAANADIGAARAAFFPSLTLSADAAAFASPTGAATSLAASLLAPIFRGGELTGGVDRANARQVELAENYRKTVLTSFKEVEDALAAVKAATERMKQFETAAAEASNAYTIARARFDAGSIDFQTLLDTQSAHLQADDNLTNARLERLSAAVQLYKSLGGTP